MGKGIFNGILQGYMQQQDLTLRKEAQQRQADNDKVDREFKVMQADDFKKKRDIEISREQDLATAFKPPDVAADGQQRPSLRPFEAFEQVAKSRALKGDLTGYQDMIGKSAAAKTLHYTTKIENAYRSGDVNSALEVLNEFPNGLKYSVQAEPGGKLLGRAFAADGSEVGQTAFNSMDEFFAHVQNKMNPRDISARLLAEADGRTKQVLAKAKADQEAADAENKRAQAGKYRAETDSEIVMRPGRVGKLDADIKQSNASAASSYASAANAGTTAEMRNFGFTKNMTPEQREAFYIGGRGGRGEQTATDPTVLVAQKALLDAATDVQKRGQLSPAQLAMADDLLAGASGKALVRKSSVGAPTEPRAKSATPIPQGAIDMLKTNPQMAADFDAKYGAQASKQFVR